MNKERIVIMIRDIERFFTDLDKFQIKSESDLYPFDKFYGVSMVLFSIVNRAIDLGEEIVTYKKLGFPNKYREIFELLHKNKIISERLSLDFSDLIHFRNLAAHEYQTLKEKEVYIAFQRMKAVNDFIAVIKKLLQEEIKKDSQKSNGKNNGHKQITNKK